MMQDSFIFSGTIMDNIRYGRLDATDEEVTISEKKPPSENKRTENVSKIAYFFTSRKILLKYV